MPFVITTQGDLLLITLRGAFTGRDLVELFNSVREVEARLPFSPHRLTDLTEATGPAITHHDIAHTVGLMKFIRYHNPHKSAVVAPGLLQYGFARMFQMLNTNPQVEVGVFRDISSARLWFQEAEEKTGSLPLA